MKKLVPLLTIFIVSFLTGCAAKPGIVPLQPGTRIVSSQAATGVAGSENFKAETVSKEIDSDIPLN